MRRPALSLAVIAGGIIAWIAVLPTAAAAGNSTADSLISTLSGKLIILGVTIAVIVELALLYAVLRYRNSGNAQPPEYNARLQLTWVLAVGVVLCFVGFASLQTMTALDQQGPQPSPDDAVRVDVVAEQWVWNFEYPRDNVTTQGTLVIPANQTVRLRVTSRDVIHSFHAPDLGVKQDANPAQWNNITFTPTDTGKYNLFCAEYCGQGHSTMQGTIRVVNSSEYDRWLEGQSSDSTANQTNASA